MNPSELLLDENNKLRACNRTRLQPRQCHNLGQNNKFEQLHRYLPQHQQRHLHLCLLQRHQQLELDRQNSRHQRASRPVYLVKQLQLRLVALRHQPRQHLSKGGGNLVSPKRMPRCSLSRRLCLFQLSGLAARQSQQHAMPWFTPEQSTLQADSFTCPTMTCTTWVFDGVRRASKCASQAPSILQRVQHARLKRKHS